MNKFKQSCLSLCLAFCLCVGFLLTDSIKVFAYDKEDNFYPIVGSETNMTVWFNNWSSSKTFYPSVVDNKYKFSNEYLENVYLMRWSFSDSSVANYTFPFNSNVYDYYILGNMVAQNSDVSKSTYKPTYYEVVGFDYSTLKNETYAISDSNIYDIDSANYSGFGWYGKIDFGLRDNIGISYISLGQDKDGIGNFPENFILEMGILAVEKSGSETAVLSQIYNQLQKMESSINSSIGNAAGSIVDSVGNAADSIVDSVGNAADSITDSIENQYKVEENEDFGVGGIQEQVEQKLGVLNFGADTLVGFLDLFSPANAGNTVITFPGFSMTIQGVKYQIWNDIVFDLKVIEDNFGILITAVRSMTVLSVWLAVLGYLVKVKDQLINNRG